ncbi:MAG TPA: dihydroneopterin aldolase [Chthoniobacterales bacterium]|nr:dihydroneopterin aldolase [Chthoniobacterales bacterium]
MKRVIEIKGLSLMAHIGVPKEERIHAQKLLIDVRCAALLQPEELKDDLSSTVDYAAVSQRLEEIAQERSRHLLETLADEMTIALLTEFQLAWIELKIRKFILPNTEYVAVTVSREAAV